MKLFNTLSRQIEEFVPQKKDEVSVYTCGLTVYSQPHIGNWVSYIYWDILVRTLTASGYKVNRVQNITDVGHLTSDEDAGEDKMLVGALREGKTAWEVADTYSKLAEDEAYNQLKLIRPNHLPRATDYIAQQIAFVQALESKGFTYSIHDGVYFDTSKLSDYGKLARLDIEGLRFGARVADTGKRNPTDFAVWKFSNPNEHRDMEWDSPWGKGFPGWHLECSAIIKELLGECIDIHTGGVDHIPIHHTNEIAQSEALTGKKFVNYWLHANHIKVNGTKMSKSLGNIYTLEDITDKHFDLQAFKLLVLSKHYRTEGNFTWDILSATQNRLKNWQSAADLRWQVTVPSSFSKQDLLHTLQNDLDTPNALALIDSWVEDTLTSHAYISEQTLTDIRDLLGINLFKDDISDAQKQVIKERESVRQQQDWVKSDQLRDQLLEQGIELRDIPGKTLWNRV